MDAQKLLEQQAAELGLPLTPLSQMNHYPRSDKVACCGGTVVRVVTESSADSTISIRDASGTCFCAVHGDITNAYPDMLTAGALVLLTNVTLLVTSGKVPPLLIACLDNLAGLMLPEPDDTAATPLAADDAWGMDRPTLACDSAGFFSGATMEESMPSLPHQQPQQRQQQQQQHQASSMRDAAYRVGAMSAARETSLEERQPACTPNTRRGSSPGMAEKMGSDSQAGGATMGGAALLGAVPLTPSRLTPRQHRSTTMTRDTVDHMPDGKEEDCLELVDDL